MPMNKDFAEIEREYYSVPSYERVKISIIEQMELINDEYKMLSMYMFKIGKKKIQDIDESIIISFVGDVLELYSMLRPKMKIHNYVDFKKYLVKKEFNLSMNEIFSMSNDEINIKYEEVLAKYDNYLYNPSKIKLEEAFEMYENLAMFVEVLGVTRIEYIPRDMGKTDGIKSLRGTAMKYRNLHKGGR